MTAAAPDHDSRRQLNDNRRSLFAASSLIAFVCECGELDCYTTVALDAGEFDQIRAARPGVLLAPGHLATMTTPAPADVAAVERPQRQQPPAPR